MSNRVEIDSREFDRAAQRLIATSKKSSEQILREQAKLVVVDAAKLTPPNKSFRWNRKGGEQTVKSDLAKLFRASSAAGAETDLAAIHKSNRNRYGRVPRNVEQVRAKGLAAYRKSVLAKVGHMAAGWKAAASKLGAKLPTWITRHNSPGDLNVSTSGSRVTLTMANKAVYSRLAAAVERRLASALKRRSRAMNRRVDYFLKQNAKAAGFFA